ncbi:hypothetical protein MHYP_G00224260 [Metynnis hypsauchen]
MRPSCAGSLMNTLWALLRCIKRDESVDDGDPVEQPGSSAPSPSIPQAALSVNATNLISGTPGLPGFAAKAKLMQSYANDGAGTCRNHINIFAKGQEKACSLVCSSALVAPGAGRAGLDFLSRMAKPTLALNPNERGLQYI